MSIIRTISSLLRPARSLGRALPLTSLAAPAGAMLILAAPAYAGPTVTVRVEGEGGTLLPRTPVTLSAPEPVSGCAPNSVAAAINLAVGGNWDHGEANNGGGDFTQTILGETHAFTNNADTWAEWVNYKWGGGICTDMLGEGDEVVMIADHEPEPFFSPTVWPLIVTGVPASSQVGVSFTVQISEIRTPAGTFAEPGEGTPTPVAGAMLTGAGVSSTSSDASGKATATLTSAGLDVVRATKPGDAPSASFTVSGHNGSDSTVGPSGVVLGSSSTSTAGSAAYKGPYAVVAKAGGVIDNHVYSPASAPRVLSGTVLAHTAVSSVSIRLRRSRAGRCYAFDGVRAAFVRARCGQGAFFKVSSSSSFSYLLPGRLARGRYVLDIEATDAAGNSTSLARGTTRVVFYVR